MRLFHAPVFYEILRNRGSAILQLAELVPERSLPERDAPEWCETSILCIVPLARPRDRCATYTRRRSRPLQSICSPTPHTREPDRTDGTMEPAHGSDAEFECRITCTEVGERADSRSVR